MLPSETVFKEAALEKGIGGAFADKDWYVTQVIRTLVEDPQNRSNCPGPTPRGRQRVLGPWRAHHHLPPRLADGARVIVYLTIFTPNGFAERVVFK